MDRITAKNTIRNKVTVSAAHIKSLKHADKVVDELCDIIDGKNSIIQKQGMAIDRMQKQIDSDAETIKRLKQGAGI